MIGMYFISQNLMNIQFTLFLNQITVLFINQYLQIHICGRFSCLLGCLYFIIVLLKIYSKLVLFHPHNKQNRCLKTLYNAQTLNQPKMGQFLPTDPYLSLQASPPPANTKKVTKTHKLSLFPYLCCNNHEITHYHETQTKIQTIYRFSNKLYIPLTLTKKQILNGGATDGGYYLDKEYLFGYKIKYSGKEDIVKNILYKKRIYGQKKVVIDKLAQLKLLSLLKIGPYIGQMIDNSDGYLTQGWLQYYGETLAKFTEDTNPLTNKIKQNFINFQMHSSIDIGYSQFWHSQALKPSLPQPDAPTQSVSQLSQINYQNLTKPSAVSQKYQKRMKQIDERTKMLSAIQNSLIHKDIQKTTNIYEKYIEKIVSPMDKVKFICQVVEVLDDCGWFKDYLEQIIQENLRGNQAYLCYDINGKSLKKRLEERAAFLKLSSKQFSSQSQIDQFSHTHSINDSELQKQRLKFNIRDSNKNRTRQLMNSMVKSNKSNSNINMNANVNVNVNKNNVNDDQRIDFQYAVMLMKSGKSNQALICFQALLRNDQVGVPVKARICTLMGLIWYYRGAGYLQAIWHWEKALIWMIRLRLFNSQMTLIYNNIACSFYKLKNYQRAIEVFKYALEHEPGKNDHNCLVRNNLALTYIKIDQLQLAKGEIMELLNRDQPINNPSILCKILTNLGYFSLTNKQITKAKDELKLAVQIQERCLLKNNYQPSPFLHNNMAIVNLKLGEFQGAFNSYAKHLDIFDQIKGIQGLFVNFNIAIVFKSNYRCQFATYYIDKCKRILAELPKEFSDKYSRKIEIAAENIAKQFIEQVSEQSSQGLFDNLASSSLSKKIEKSRMLPNIYHEQNNDNKY